MHQRKTQKVFYNTKRTVTMEKKKVWKTFFFYSPLVHFCFFLYRFMARVHSSSHASSRIFFPLTHWMSFPVFLHRHKNSTGKKTLQRKKPWHSCALVCLYSKVYLCATMLLHMVDVECVFFSFHVWIVHYRKNRSHNKKS